jgi:hypothetical protein
MICHIIADYQNARSLRGSGPLHERQGEGAYSSCQVRPSRSSSATEAEGPQVPAR